EAYDNSDVPFQELVRCLRPAPRSMRSPFFQVTFGFDSDVGKNASRSLQIDATSGTARYDLTLQLAESADGIYGSMEYCTDLFDKPIMAELSRQFVALLGEISANPDSSVSDLRLSEVQEKGDPSSELHQEGSWTSTVQRFMGRFSHRSQ
ncbi:MAG: condensation domain-containing protein, partial [Acidobacteriaceae bacterium]